MKPKHILSSRTVQGLILMALAHFAPRLGIAVDSDALGQMLDEASVVVGLIWALYGRIKAERPLRLMPSGTGRG